MRLKLSILRMKCKTRTIRQLEYLDAESQSSGLQLFTFLLPEHNHTRDWCLPTVPENEGTLVEKGVLMSLEITWGLTVTKLI